MIRRVLAATGVMLSVAVGLFVFPDTATAQYNPIECSFSYTPPSVAAGDSITITGQGFPSGALVTFMLNGSILAQANASTDGTGFVTVDATIPANLPAGTYDISTSDCPNNSVAVQAINVSAGSSANSSGNAGSSSGSLTSTGRDPVPMIKIALMLLAGGGLVLLASRRRQHART